MGQDIKSKDLFSEVEFTAEDRQKVQDCIKNSEKPLFFKWRIKSIAAAAVLLTLAGSLALFGSGTKAFAFSNFPFFDSIFSLFGDEGLQKASNDGNVSLLSLEKQEDGIKMSIKEAVYDGRRLSISYVIESEKPINNYSYKQIDAYIPLNHSEEGISRNGVRDEQISENKVAGISTFTYDYDKGELPDKIKVDFLYKATTDKSYKWEKDFSFRFQFPVEKSEDIKTIPMNMVKQWENKVLELKSIKLSPLTTSVNLRYKEPYNNREPYPSHTIRLIDENGKVLRNLNNWTMGMGTQTKENGQWYSVTEYKEFFEQVDKGSSTVTIQVINGTSNRFKEDTPLSSTPLSTEAAFQMGEMGSIEIEGIERADQTLIIAYKYKSSLAFLNDFQFMLTDKNGEFYHGIEKSREYLGGEAYLVEEVFPNTPDEGLFIKYFNEKAPELIEEFQMEVPIK
ncbi:MULTISPECIES: DUF4179 domain-containing protein [Bacillus]|uniref:DUF4179 domain-containing protein n=1 Tax=Bacillus infantis NRRL B-14911 TaxID=1367477 RepID=U5L6L7_9BACI|nr:MULTISPECIES: DUF4179 domain-containing protein [Bacillus]AGX03013.1 hypothetical protein N288_05290 [Bacillus infantis NRRL B-14911]EAR63520.1 ECF-type sigma factor negative effector [Bacillus sp. NRRL B-14911]MCP1157247.1 DUF4179 domain-containing protein [Bacillus infantis]MDT0162847.1 DUF4179 domain-containing protein [Bacillus sp. AG4(2022)]